MRFATYDDGTLDGQLLVVAPDGVRATAAASAAPSLLVQINDRSLRKLGAYESRAASASCGRSPPPRLRPSP
jgi:hypothetical protein